MQVFGILVFSLFGMASIAGLSFGLYILLPASMLAGAAGHGRFSGLGTRDRLHAGTAGSAPAANVRAFQGQSV